MSQASNVVEAKITDHLTGKTAYASPAPLYLALCIAAPGETDTGSTIVEATYTGYARLQVPAADWNAANVGTGTAVTNAIKTFAACTAGTSACTHFAWCSALTLGDVIAFGALAATLNVSTAAQPVSFAAGNLQIATA